MGYISVFLQALQLISSIVLSVISNRKDSDDKE